MRHDISILTILAFAPQALEEGPMGFKVELFEFNDTRKGLFQEGSIILHFTLVRVPCAPLTLTWKEEVHAWTIAATLLGTTITIRQQDLGGAVRDSIRGVLRACADRNWTAAPK